MAARYAAFTIVGFSTWSGAAADNRRFGAAHTLRRTVKTRMGELGIAKDVRDRLQNHAAMNVSAKHYDRYDYMAEKRAAAERWCDFLEVTISSGNVVPMRKAGEG